MSNGKKNSLYIIIPVLFLMVVSVFIVIDNQAGNSEAGVHSFSISNTHYSIISEDERTVELFYVDIIRPGQEYYHVYMPETVSYKGVEYTVVAIGDGAYSGKNLVNVYLPPSIREIGKEAFSDTSLEGFYMTDNVVSIGSGAFKDCDRLESIQLSKGLTSLANDVFKGCKKLQSIEIPDEIKTLGKNTFKGCTSLKNLKIPVHVEPVVNKNNPVFNGCKNIKEVTFTKGTGIGVDYTMYSKTPWFIYDSIKTVTISDGITYIGSNMLRGCSGITEITIPDSVIEIGSGAFQSCTSLEVINHSSDYIEFGSSTFGECTSLMGFDVPYGTTHLADSLFKDCKNLRYVNIPETVSVLGKSVFAGCESLNEFLIPETIEKLGEHSFKDCTGLKKLTLPISLDVVSSSSSPAFKGCNNISEYIFTPGEGDSFDYTNMTSEETGAFNVTPWHLAKVPITVTLQEGVKSIGSHMFYACENLTDIIFPNTLESIHKGAFQFSGLESVVISDSVTHIGYCAFDSLEHIRSFHIGISVCVVEKDAFRGMTFCESDGTVIFPSIENIRGFTYKGEPSMMLKYIPNSLSVSYS